MAAVHAWYSALGAQDAATLQKTVVRFESVLSAVGMGVASGDGDGDANGDHQRIKARRHLFVAVSLLDATAAVLEAVEGPKVEEEGRRLRELAVSHLRRAVESDATLHQARMELCLALEESRDLAGERARGRAGERASGRGPKRCTATRL